ncbi:small RNA degrading nuclease 5 [Drosophila busckii]|uniref:small RNA degrading nuclease 5 n=1 Tax=Drosophila busckii TaxID=30019 RepID=UPI00083E9FE3|nr:small RNA degrading nuclease 5 [Drosophila busckii]XP_017844111.1 small RNA degrading nuclease 5 [Drosophila busckii]
MQNSVKCLLFQLLRLVHLPQRVSKMCGTILYAQPGQNECLTNRRTKMKNQVSSKQHERNEKKKKKLAALANLIQMNDRDRAERIHEVEPADKEDDDFIAVCSKRKPRNRLTIMPDSSSTSSNEAIVAANGNADEADSDEPEIKRIRNNSAGGDNVPSTLTQDQYKTLSLELRRRKRELESVPTLHLREMGRRAQLEIPQQERTPIFLTDIQHLLMSALIGKKSPCVPDRWCAAEKFLSLSHSVVLILEGLSLYHYISNESRFEATNRIFDTKLEVVLPPQDEGKIIDEIAQIPLTNVQAQKLINEHGSLESAVELSKDPTLFVKTIFPIEKQAPSMQDEATDLHPDDKFPRTKLLLSALQMVDEGYPIPLQGELHARFQTYMFTKKSYTPVTNRSPMFGVDCEMCRTVSGENELTRISIVDEEYRTVYETLVRPVNEIVDYLTQYSGITPDLMESVTKKLSEVQSEVSALLPPDAILVGQSLNSDLNAMRMMHPYVIDTSVCFNISGVRKRKSKLKHLAKMFLQESIQENEDGHDSIEDSRATLKLVKMKLANSIEFGDEILTQRKRIHEVIRASAGDGIANNLFAHVAKRDKRTAIVTVGDLQPGLKEIIRKAEQATPKDSSKAVQVHEVSSSKEAVRKVNEIAMENALTIANLIVPERDFLVESAERSAAKLDKFIERMWSTVAHNGLFLVLMGGSAECQKGVAKIAIKRLNGISAVAPINFGES